MEPQENQTSEEETIPTGEVHEINDNYDNLDIETLNLLHEAVEKKEVTGNLAAIEAAIAKQKAAML